MSLRAFVLTDPALAPLAQDFVWLSIDTERESNDAFVRKYPNRAWPTLWVIDPARDEPVLRWEGAATAAELRDLLTASRAGSSGEGAAATATFVRANQAAAVGDAEQAERGYRDALAAADRAHPHRGRMVEALISLLTSQKSFAACAELAVREAPGLPNATSRAVALTAGLSCARDAKQKPAIAELARMAELLAADPRASILADDRSGLYEELVETKKEDGDSAGAKSVARAWASFLEGEAKKAPTKDARAVFDPHRLLAYIALGDVARAIPMLSESERDFPEDYNPPARLARAYLELGRLPEAGEAIDRATGLVYGPRALRVFELKADIAKARGDPAVEEAALREALRRTERSVLTESQKKLRAKLSSRVKCLFASEACALTKAR